MTASGGARRAASGDPRRGRLPSVTTQIFVGLVLGTVVGYLWPSFGVSIRPLADAFLRLIKMIVAPLLFSTLVIGVAGAGDLKSLDRKSTRLNSSHIQKSRMPSSA